MPNPSESPKSKELSPQEKLQKFCKDENLTILPVLVRVDAAGDGRYLQELAIQIRPNV